MLLFLSHLSAGLQVQESPTGGSTGALAASSSSPEAGTHHQSGNISAAEVARRFQEFKSSPYYVAPFEDNLMAIPEAQVQFVREASQRDFELFRSISRDAVQRRGKFGSGVSLVVKYTGKLLGTFIRNRQEELRLPEFKDPKSEFFDYMADLISRGIDLSGELKREKYYSKSRVDSDDFYQRVDALFGYLTKMLNKCPLGMYLKWADLHLFKDEPSNKRHNVSILDEGADLFAVSKALVELWRAAAHVKREHCTNELTWRRNGNDGGWPTMAQPLTN